MKANEKKEPFYLEQNKVLHIARALLGMSIDDCRELARQFSGKPSLSSLTDFQRWQLIEDLRSKGAKVYNPPLPREGVRTLTTEEVYPARLSYWKKRFPNPRPGFASAWQLAWIQALWELNFDHGQGARGLRRFIYRQTQNLEQGPVSDLAFLREDHVEAVITPLKEKALEKQQAREGGNNG